MVHADEGAFLHLRLGVKRHTHPGFGQHGEVIRPVAHGDGVRRVEADYLRPARFGDDLIVVTRLREMAGARIVLEQEVQRLGERLFQALVTLVCLTDDGHATRIPPDVRARLMPPVH